MPVHHAINNGTSYHLYAISKNDQLDTRPTRHMSSCFCLHMSTRHMSTLVDQLQVNSSQANLKVRR